jgi:enhancing lycopene biosynthesis protein 2
MGDGHSGCEPIVDGARMQKGSVKPARKKKGGTNGALFVPGGQ